MAIVYILYSKSAGKYYIGSTKELKTRIELHMNKTFVNSFTSIFNDWELEFEISNISISSAKKIETHIKKMKSKAYIQNLKKYPILSDELVKKYSCEALSR